MSKFCLLMIVKNESSNIIRTLDSTKHTINSYYIQDTGSTDGTQDIIRHYMIKHNIPGELYERKWSNYSFNKSLLFSDARNHENKLISNTDYYISLDSDEAIVDYNNDYLSLEDSNSLYLELNKQDNSNIFMINTKIENLEYKRCNIFKNNQIYSVSEDNLHILGLINNYTCNINLITILVKKDDKNNQKYISIFLDFIKYNPRHAIATFYLAQTYESFNIIESIKYYKKCIDFDGFYQQKYIACLKLGRKLDKIKYFLKGIDIDPKRLECYYELMMMEFNKKSFRKGAGWGLMAPNDRKIDKDFMFTEHEIYNHLFDINLSVCCSNSELHEEAYKIGVRAENMSKKSSYETLTQNNLVWFSKQIKNNIPIIKHRKELIIIDNFYDNPDSVRQDALTAEYPIHGNYPGKRTNPVFYDNIKEKFESIIGSKIIYWPLDSYNGSFQIVMETDKSWIHRDLTEWSAVVFLTPNPPKDGGTKFYIHKPTQKSYTENKLIESIMIESTHKSDDWELLDTVGNLYNRCVLFRGKRTHISDRYFGTELNNCRLFQTFFFDD